MDSELSFRLEKVLDEADIALIDEPQLLDLTILTIEAVKAHKIQSGQYPNNELICFDLVSGALRNQL